MFIVISINTHKVFRWMKQSATVIQSILSETECIHILTYIYTWLQPLQAEDNKRGPIICGPLEVKVMCCSPVPRVGFLHSTAGRSGAVVGRFGKQQFPQHMRKTDVLLVGCERGLRGVWLRIPATSTDAMRPTTTCSHLGQDSTLLQL